MAKMNWSEMQYADEKDLKWERLSDGCYRGTGTPYDAMIVRTDKLPGWDFDDVPADCQEWAVFGDGEYWWSTSTLDSAIEKIEADIEEREDNLLRQLRD